MYRVFQGGSIAAYEHVAMIKAHYRIADTLDYCLDALQNGKQVRRKDRPVLRLDIFKPVESVSVGGGQDTCVESDTLSTHSSERGDDDATSCPSKWEAIPEES